MTTAWRLTWTDNQGNQWRRTHTSWATCWAHMRRLTLGNGSPFELISETDYYLMEGRSLPLTEAAESPFQELKIEPLEEDSE